ncbi:MAG: hypothetical protein CMJ66_02085 [Planctomycetaceae bacterium]|nr:hypothetical protein [Planctomycetaceae bacterium]
MRRFAEANAFSINVSDRTVDMKVQGFVARTEGVVIHQLNLCGQRIVLTPIFERRVNVLVFMKEDNLPMRLRRLFPIIYERCYAMSGTSL